MTFAAYTIAIVIFINILARLKRTPANNTPTTPPAPTPTYRIAGFYLIVDGKKTCKTPPLPRGQTKNEIVTVGNTVMVNGYTYDPAKEKFIGWN